MDKLNNAQNYLQEFAEEFIAYLPNLVAAILLLIIGWWFIKVILRYAKKIFAKRALDPAIQKFSLTIINWALKILLFVIVIGQLGVETTSLIAVLGAAGLAIGLALQGSLSNFAGGVIIILMKPFKLGDWIEVNGISGSVKDISLFYTKLNTFGNQLAVIPNGELSNDNIINYSAEPTRRDAITIGISYDSDIKLAKEILLELLQEQENIEKEPAPEVLVAELADSAVNLSVRFWAKNENFWDAHWFTIEEAKRRLEAAGISIPFPQRDVHIVNNGDKKPLLEKSS
ncbi:MAG TPA: mechanosensitive ion channel domain-containing protein [Salinimicrobium sp.]|nr:mechanosensitive ion channel domain-containing protein [Salinimicrobium sp.]